jgi:predicted CXXCH cytochrome family protein
MNLLNDHPISFTFDGTLRSADGELVDPATLTGDIQLREGSTAGVADEVQCTTCHDAHEQARPKFLRKDLKGRLDNLCLTCHDKPGWSGSTHEGSTEFWPAAQTTEMVQDHSCVACHSPHTESGAERLLRNGASGGQAAIEQTCYQCHTTTGAGGIAQDLQAQFSKSSAHPVTLNPGGHKPMFLTRGSGPGLPENVLLSPGSAAEDASYFDVDHVECVDCHNPHRVTAANRTEGMRGIGIDGSEIANVANDPAPANSQASATQYPVCLRCHGDTFADVIGTAPLASGAVPGNKRAEFMTGNSSFHPVAGPGKNTSTRLNQQLTGQGLSTSSVIKCTDCHNTNAYENDTGRMRSTGTTAADPVGPHGSTYQSILRAPYWNQLPGPSSWNANNFKLCFRCHSANLLLSDNNGSEFDDQVDGRDNLHNVHLDDRSNKAGAICQSCHYNIHSNQTSTTTQYNVDGVVTNTPPTGVTTALINFHPNIRGIGGRPRPEWWYRSSDQERRCYLQCHTPGGGTGGETMNGLPYGPG